MTRLITSMYINIVHEIFSCRNTAMFRGKEDFLPYHFVNGRFLYFPPEQKLQKRRYTCYQLMTCVTSQIGLLSESWCCRYELSITSFIVFFSRFLGSQIGIRGAVHRLDHLVSSEVQVLQFLQGPFSSSELLGRHHLNDFVLPGPGSQQYSRGQIIARSCTSNI